MDECCYTCNNCLTLKKSDYSSGGCKHSTMEGFACLVFADEGIVEWMVGLNPNNRMCECYSERKNKQEIT